MSLRDRMRKLFSRRESDVDGSMTHLSFATHLNMIIVSLAVAVIAWFFAMSGQINESSVMIPVKLRGIDPRMEVRVVPDTVRVWVTHPKNIQSYINSDNLLFDVNIDTLIPDLSVNWKKQSYVLDNSLLVATVPSGQVILSGKKNSYPRVEVSYRWKAWEADVLPTVTGVAQLADKGLAMLKEASVSPRQVWIVGEQDIINTLPRDPVTQRLQVHTDRLVASDYDQAVLKTVGISLPPGLDIIQPKSATVEVSLDIQPITTEREITNVPIPPRLFATDTLDAECDVSSVKVVVRGPENIIKRLDPSSFLITPLRPAEELPNTTREVKVSAMLRSDVSGEFGTRITIVGVEPKTVTVKYKKKE
ncbi:hypothetical protein GX645_01375 [Candidatus Sumerlaeota bacterium]|nr:hypothetical protein [Candidatus Sumerlaeota bacterium]